MLSFITGALGFLGRLPGGALNLIDRRRQWATADRVEIDDSFTAEIASLKEELAEAEGDDERLSLKEAIMRARQEQRSFHRARRELLLSKSLVQRMTPTGEITAGGPELPLADRQILEAAAAVVAQLEPPQTFQEHLRQGDAFYTSRQFDKALEEYHRAVQLKPDSPAALMNSGNALERLNRNDEAITYFNRSLEFRPNYPSALTGRAMATESLKRFDEALADYRRSLELRPDDPITLNNRGNTLQGLQRYEEALADYDRALQLQPAYAEIPYNRASTLSLMSRLTEALDQLEEAISSDATFRQAARTDKDFANLRSDPALGPEFERLVAEPEAASSHEPESH